MNVTGESIANKFVFLSHTSGNIFSRLSARYTLVARSWASRSSRDPGIFTKWCSFGRSDHHNPQVRTKSQFREAVYLLLQNKRRRQYVSRALKPIIRYVHMWIRERVLSGKNKNFILFRGIWRRIKVLRQVLCWNWKIHMSMVESSDISLEEHDIKWRVWVTISSNKCHKHILLRFSCLQFDNLVAITSVQRNTVSDVFLREILNKIVKLLTIEQKLAWIEPSKESTIWVYQDRTVKLTELYSWIKTIELTLTATPKFSEIVDTDCDSQILRYSWHWLRLPNSQI